MLRGRPVIGKVVMTCPSGSSPLLAPSQVSERVSRLARCGRGAAVTTDCCSWSPRHGRLHPRDDLGLMELVLRCRLATTHPAHAGRAMASGKASCVFPWA